MSLLGALHQCFPIAESAQFDYTTPMRSISRILVLVKTGHHGAFVSAKAMCERLSTLGLDWCLDSPGAEEHWLTQSHAPAAIVVFGGDGTLVGALRRLVGLSVNNPELAETPVMGVNFGKVGFLVEVEDPDWPAVLDDLLAGRARLAPRTALEWSLWRDGIGLERGHAVNDIVVGRGSLARVLGLGLSVNGDEVSRVRADGMLVSTPAGSSGYGCSAGGSLVHPDLEALMVMPIAPFLRRSVPMVLPADSRLCLTHLSGTDAFLTVDGQDGVPLHPGDAVCVRGLPRAFTLVTGSTATYYERLRRCGFVGLDESSAGASCCPGGTHA